MNPIAASRAPFAAARTDAVRKQEEPAKDSHPASVDFPALLALLAGTGPRVRQQMMNSLSDADRSLLDGLLDGATASSSGEAALLSGETPAESAVPGSDTLSQAASDAMRYGAITRDESARDSRSDASRSAASRAAALLASVPGSESASSSAAPLQRALARAASRRSSVEQLLARGDENGASIRGALDSILDRAGTDSAAALAMLGGSSIPAAAAIAASAATTGPSANGNVSDVNRDTSSLVPEFRLRLERVVERMKAEYGHDVSLVETSRSQERQDFLYEQGRTRPGQVVTWTHDSAHTRGEAADVMIDGTWNNADGFARLQRVAREEGLRTLGVKDPGHLELPRDARAAESMLNPAARVSNRIEHPVTATASGVSNVASVAGVAGVAGVARVAERSPAARTLDAVPASVIASGAAYSAASRTAGASSNSSGNARSESDSTGSHRSRDSHRAGSADAASGTSSSASYNGSAGTLVGAPNTLKTGEPGAAPANTAQRATDAQDLRESTPGSLSRLTMSVDGANGDDRITIDLRGKTVGTHITTDANTADGLRARTGELQDALGRHGLDADSVRISNTARTEAGDASRAAGTERDALKLAGAAQGSAGDGATGNGSRERASTPREFEKEQDARRAREEQKEQDARRRGQGRNFNEDPR